MQSWVPVAVGNPPCSDFWSGCMMHRLEPPSHLLLYQYSACSRFQSTGLTFLSPFAHPSVENLKIPEMLWCHCRAVAYSWMALMSGSCSSPVSDKQSQLCPRTLFSLLTPSCATSDMDAQTPALRKLSALLVGPPTINTTGAAAQISMLLSTWYILHDPKLL